MNAKVVQVDSSAGGNTSPFIEYIDQGVPTRVQAKTVLVTASLGALKNDIIEFLPELPAYKQDTIDNMSFGLLNKVMMVRAHWLLFSQHLSCLAQLTYCEALGRRGEHGLARGQALVYAHYPR